MGKNFSRYAEEPPEQKKGRMQKHFTIRLNIFFFVTFLIFTVLIVRLAILQFVESKYLKEETSSITKSNSPIAPIRGTIFDRTGYPIAQSRSMQSVYYRVEGRATDKDDINH
jgi:penicillin-binding protein 2